MPPNLPPRVAVLVVTRRVAQVVATYQHPLQVMDLRVVLAAMDLPVVPVIQVVRVTQVRTAALVILVPMVAMLPQAGMVPPVVPHLPRLVMTLLVVLHPLPPPPQVVVPRLRILRQRLVAAHHQQLPHPLVTQVVHHQ